MKRGSMHMMSTRLLRGAGAAVLFASLVCAQAGPDGHWEGFYKVNNSDIEYGISLDLAKNEKSEWIRKHGPSLPKHDRPCRVACGGKRQVREV